MDCDLNFTFPNTANRLDAVEVVYTGFGSSHGAESY